MVVMLLGGRAKMLEATCAVPLYRVECDNQGPGKRTAPQPWDGQSSPRLEGQKNLEGYSLAVKAMQETA